MKFELLKNLCVDIFAGPSIFTNKSLSHEDTGGYRVIRLADIENDEISYEKSFFYNNISDFSKNRYLLKKNDILISSRGTIFKVAIIKENIDMTIPSGYLSCVRLSPKINISPNYVASYIRHLSLENIISKQNQKILPDRKIGFRFKTVDICNIRIPIVKSEIQSTIDRLYDEYMKLKQESHQKKKEIKNIIFTIKKH
ncbi:MAG: restriction endonuclease subunit S [Candidatus Gastranaerophilales bacterium]|nr:restriction endonuclease subunit S [Candidatus Gastranaerophilales bacterium]